MAFLTGIEDLTPAKLKRGSRGRKLYQLTFDHRAGGMPGYSLENLQTLLPGRHALWAPPGRGFPNYPEAPRILLNDKTGRLPRDFELFHDYWLVADRAKSVFEAVDPAGFAFVPCELRVPTGDYHGPGYWLCDIVRTLDALDEIRSRLKIGTREDPRYLDFGKKFYSITGGASLVFRGDIVGDAHVFHMAHLQSIVICDQSLKDACKAANLKGVRFRDVLKL